MAVCRKDRQLFKCHLMKFDVQGWKLPFIRVIFFSPNTSSSSTKWEVLGLRVSWCFLTTINGRGKAMSQEHSLFLVVSSCRNSLFTSFQLPKAMTVIAVGCNGSSCWLCLTAAV